MNSKKKKNIIGKRSLISKLEITEKANFIKYIFIILAIIIFKIKILKYCTKIQSWSFLMEWIQNAVGISFFIKYFHE